jgi:hypothetical protein
MREILSVAACAMLSALVQGCAGTAMSETATGGGAASPPSYGTYGAESFFKVEAQPDERRGRPTVSGYVTNQGGKSARNVRLRVEALDAAGAVSGTTIGYVSGYVTPGSRVYFEVPVPSRAAGYRVSVLSFDIIQGHT